MRITQLGLFLALGIFPVSAGNAKAQATPPLRVLLANVSGAWMPVGAQRASTEMMTSLSAEHGFSLVVATSLSDFREKMALSGFPNVTCNRRGTGLAGISQGENVGKSWSGA